MVYNFFINIHVQSGAIHLPNTKNIDLWINQPGGVRPHHQSLSHRKLGGQQQSNTKNVSTLNVRLLTYTDLTNSFKITELKSWVFTSSQTPGHLAVWRTATEFLCHLSAAELTVVPLATTHHVTRSIDPLFLLPPCFPFQSPDCNPKICDKLINNDKQHSLE